MKLQYAGIGDSEAEVAAYHAALQAMLNAGTLAEYDEPGYGRRIHFPEVVEHLDPSRGERTHRAFLSALRDLTDDVTALTEQAYDPAALHLDAVQVAGTRSAIADAVQHVMALTVRLGEIDAVLAALETSPEESASAGA
jgi:hypothetical protein